MASRSRLAGTAQVGRRGYKGRLCQSLSSWIVPKSPACHRNGKISCAGSKERSVTAIHSTTGWFATRKQSTWPHRRLVELPVGRRLLGLLGSVPVQLPESPAPPELPLAISPRLDPQVGLFPRRLLRVHLPRRPARQRRLRRFRPVLLRPAGHGLRARRPLRGPPASTGNAVWEVLRLPTVRQWRESSS
jgi:hypothetical protein